MSIAAVNPDATTPVVPKVPGTQKLAICRINFDSSYPTGGEIVTPASVGLSQIDAIIVSAGSLAGRVVTPVLASGVWKLKVYVVGAIVASGNSETIAATALTEVDDTTNLSADYVHAIVVGK